MEEAIKKRYPVVYEWSGRNYGAHAPDVPGCIATGKTLEEVAERFREALAFHFEGMALAGEVIPEPTTLVGYAEVELPAPAVAAG